MREAFRKEAKVALMERLAVAKTPPNAPHVNNAQHQPNEPSVPAHSIVGVQSFIGNHALQRLLNSQYIQTKLQVSTPGDPFEQEADRVADNVMRMPERDPPDDDKPEIAPVVQQKSVTDIPVRRRSSEEEESKAQQTETAPPIQRRLEDDEELQNQFGFAHAKQAEVSPAQTTERRISDVLPNRGEGSALPPATCAFFETRFGVDFSSVRIQTGARVAEAARALHARAFTIGSDIAFGEGEYQPESKDGRRLLAHELTHVVQQRNSNLSPVKNAETGTPGSAPRNMVQRQPAPTPANDKSDPREKAQAALKALGLTLSDDDLSQILKQLPQGDIVLNPVQLTLYGRSDKIAAAVKVPAKQVAGSTQTLRSATYIFEIGAGRAILVVGVDGASRLFDAGNLEGRVAAGINYLIKAGLTKTPGVVKISHTDSDHMQDLKNVVDGTGMPKPVVEITKQQLTDPGMKKFAESRLLAVRPNIVEIDVTGEGTHVHREISGALQYTDFRWAPAHAALAGGNKRANNPSSPVTVIRDLITGEVRVYTADAEPSTVMKMFNYIHPSAMPYLFGEGQLKEFELPHHGGASTETRRTEAGLNYVRLLRLAYEASDGTTTFFAQTEAQKIADPKEGGDKTNHVRALHAAGFPIETVLLGNDPAKPNIRTIKGGVIESLNLTTAEQNEVKTKVQPNESALMKARRAGDQVAKVRAALQIQMEAAQAGSPQVAKAASDSLEKLKNEDKARSDAVAEWWNALSAAVVASGGFNEKFDATSCRAALEKLEKTPLMTPERIADFQRSVEFNSTMMEASGRVGELALGMCDALLKQDHGRMTVLKEKQGEAYRTAVAAMGNAKVDEALFTAWKAEMANLQKIQGQLLEMGYEAAKAKAENRMAARSMGALAAQMQADAMVARAEGGFPRSSGGNISRRAQVGAGAMAALEVIKITLELWRNIQAGMAATEARAVKRQLRGWNKMRWWQDIGATPQVEIVDDNDNPLSPRLTDVQTIYKVLANEKIDDSFKVPDKPRIVITGLSKNDQMLAATHLFLKASNLDEWHKAVNDARGQQDEEGRPPIEVDDTGKQWGVYVWDFQKKNYVQQVNAEVSEFLDRVYKTAFENSDAELKQSVAKSGGQFGTVKATGIFSKTRDVWIYPQRGGLHKSQFPFEPSLTYPKVLRKGERVVAKAADAQTYDFLRQFLWLREEQHLHGASPRTTVVYEPNTEGKCYVDVDDLEVRPPPPKPEGLPEGAGDFPTKPPGSMTT